MEANKLTHKLTDYSRPLCGYIGTIGKCKFYGNNPRDKELNCPEAEYVTITGVSAGSEIDFVCPKGEKLIRGYYRKKCRTSWPLTKELELLLLLMVEKHDAAKTREIVEGWFKGSKI